MVCYDRLTAVSLLEGSIRPRLLSRHRGQGRKEKCKLIEKAQLHCTGIGRNADDWAVVSVSALYGASAATYTGKTRLRM